MRVEEDGNDIKATEILDRIFMEAIKRGASDVHFEPQRSQIVIRYRIDGELVVATRESLSFYAPVLARIKVLTNLDLTGIPRPQEGNIMFESPDYGNVDLRISIFPVVFGECVVIRVLRDEISIKEYSDIGFSGEQIEELDDISRKPNGLILVTGPTGSGKSTTIFTILNKLNTIDRSVVTLEDPVERKIDMVRQTNINHEVGLTFAEGLRRLMRQDPDIIMVGEIRDTETAKIAVEAAVTGNLVLATIHTNNASGAIVRLINMGVEPFLLASALKMVTAQRLARLSCTKCKKEYTPSEELTKSLDLPAEMKFAKSEGCDKCGFKGVKGRKAFHEVFVVDSEIEELMLTRPSDLKIQNMAVAKGMRTLKQSALEMVDRGEVSLEEAIRLTG